MAFSEAEEQISAPVDNIGKLLRYWRKRRGRSQLELALDSGVSQRHISFIESGRSAPSRDMVVDLAQALDVPLRERNTLLLSAGYAPLYRVSQWDSEDMRPIMKALKRMLEQHEPHPAVVMDRYWNIMMTNEGAPKFFNSFVDLKARQGTPNILHLMFDPKGMRPFVRNWDTVVYGLLQRVRCEAIGQVIDIGTGKLLDELLAYPDVREISMRSWTPGLSPVIPVEFARDGKVSRYFSMITTVGTPQCITSQELRMECMFPVDEK